MGREIILVGSVRPRERLRLLSMCSFSGCALVLVPPHVAQPDLVKEFKDFILTFEEPKEFVHIKESAYERRNSNEPFYRRIKKKPRSN